jgi:outer membrane protein assembly factor BamB
MGSTNNDANPFTPVGKTIVVKELCPLWAKFGQNNRRQSPSIGPKEAIAIRWSYEIGSSISSAAIDLNDIVYIGSDAGVFAFDSWGKFLWSYSTGAPIRSSPVIDSAGNVLIHSAGTVYSVRNGALIWKYATLSSDTGSGIQSSLTLTREGYAIFGSLDSYVYCLKDGLLLWSVKTGSAIRGSATVVDTTLYIGSTDSKLYAIDTLNGKILWTYVTGGAIVSTPGIANGYIYFGSSDQYVYCLTNAGLLQWRYSTGGAVHASPAIGDSVYITSEDQYIYALDPILGTRKWRTLLDTSPTSPTLGNNGRLYVATLANLYTLNNLGSIVSKYISGSRASPTLSRETTLYLCSGEHIYSIQNTISNVTISSGWFTFGQNNQRQSSYAGAISGLLLIRKRFFLEPIFSSPSILQNILYIGGGSKLYAIDTISNEILWSYTTDGIVNSSPTILADGTIFFGSTDGYIYSVSPSGTLIWKFKTGSDGIRDAFIQGTNSTILLSNGYAIFGSFDYYIYCISSIDGTLVWKVQTGGWVQGSAAVSGTTVYIGSADYKLYAINIFTGSILWTYTTESGIDSVPAIGYNGLIYFGSIDNTFYALNPSGGLEWKYTASSSIYSSAAINIFGTVYFLSSDGYLHSVKGDTGELIWRIFLERGFTPSSPLIGSDRNIYVGCSSKLYIVNERTGLIVLTYSLDSSIESSPLLGSDGTIYIGTVGGYLYSLTNTIPPPIWPMIGFRSTHTTAEKGPTVLNLAWRVQLNTSATFVSSPCINRNGIVYVGSENGLVALDSLTGNTLWIYSTGPVYSSPTIDGNGNVYFNSYDGYTYAVFSNSLVWKFYTSANSISTTSVTVYDKYLIFGSIDSYVYCVYLDSAVIWRFKTGAAIQGSPVIDKQTVYIGSTDSVLYAIDFVKGKLNYIYKCGGPIYSTPAVEICGNIYITSLDSKIHALNKGCNRIWSYTTGGPIYSSVAIGANRTLYVTSTDGYLYAIQGEDGSLVWKIFLGLGLKCTPMIDVKGNIYVASSIIYVINSSGNIISQYTTQGSIESYICIYNEKLYVSSTDGYIYAISNVS